MNEWMKSHRSACASSKPQRTYWSLIPQLETVIEVSTVQVLRWRVNPWRLHGAKFLPSMNLYGGQTSYLNMNVLTIVKMRIWAFFKPLLAWSMIKNVDTSVTTQTSSRLAALEPCIKTRVLLDSLVRCLCLTYGRLPLLRSAAGADREHFFLLHRGMTNF